MRIGAFSRNNIQINNKNTSFGHIYSKAVDTIRYNCDGYYKTFQYDGFDDYHDCPYLKESYECKEGQNGIKFMDDQDVAFLQQLVERASKLTKSIISKYGNRAIALVVNEDDKRNFILETGLIDGDVNHNLNQFRTLVEAAEEYENNPEKTEIEPIYRPLKYSKLKNCEPRYQDMYSYTIHNDGRNENKGEC